MINYLITKSKEKIIRHVHWFEAFEESDSIEEFLQKTKFSKKFLNDLMEKIGDDARKDFDEIKGKYFIKDDKNDSSDN